MADLPQKQAKLPKSDQSLAQVALKSTPAFDIPALRATLSVQDFQATRLRFNCRPRRYQWYSVSSLIV